jgi:N-acetylmuramoyl-L-alanine amidase
VGLQVGHWHIAALPDSLARLRDQTGTAAAGHTELQLNLDVVRRTAALLEAAGVQVDVLPATVPDGYRADAFVAIHADGNFARAVRGYKVAPPWRSGVAWADAALAAQIQVAYSTATRLPRDPEITDNMRGYYAINGWMGTESRISDGTPSAVIETGFMTSAADRAVLFDHPERVAAGLATGILAFLQSGAGTAAEQQRAETVAALAPTGCSVVVLLDDVPLRAAPAPDAPAVAWVNRGAILPYLDSTARPRGPFTNTAGRRLAVQTGYYRVGRPGGGVSVYINRATVVVQLPPPSPPVRAGSAATSPTVRWSLVQSGP